MVRSRSRVASPGAISSIRVMAIMESFLTLRDAQKNGPKLQVLA